MSPLVSRTSTPARRESPDWYSRCSNVAELMRWLADRGELTVDTAIDIVEKPWHWTPERDEMIAERERDQITGADHVGARS
jgi:hypothetical protein